MTHIVAVAARTPVGLHAAATAAAIRAGISNVREHPIFVDARGEPVCCGRDAVLDAELIGRQRFVELASTALDELAEDLAPGLGQRRLNLYLALPEERPGFDAADAQWIVAALARRPFAGAKVEVRAAGVGHAGVHRCIEQAIARIKQSPDELFVVGGVDSYLDGGTLDWLEEERRLACGDARGGFPPGEGAAFLALAGEGGRRRLRLPSLATIRAVACTVETRDEDSAESLQGEGLTAAFEKVGAHLRPSELIDESFCDINNERARTTDLAFALLRAGALFRDTAYTTPVACVGDQGAASGALNCVLATRAWARRYARGATTLVFGASWGGTRGAVLLERPV